MTKPYKDSASRKCPNGHEYTIEGGADWADEDICPDCGAEPGDKVTPEDATPEVLEEWLGDNGCPGCPACETGDAVGWVPVEDRPAPGARWQCDCCGRYIDAAGAAIKLERGVEA